MSAKLLGRLTINTKAIVVGALSASLLLTSCSLDGGSDNANKEQSMADAPSTKLIACFAGAG